LTDGISTDITISMEIRLSASLRIGAKKGLRSSLGIIKVMLPVTLAVTLLKISPLLGWLSEIFKPVMGLVGLRGETALPFILGSVLNLYVAIGAMIPLGLTAKETTILATMLLLSHNLFVETAVIRGMDAPWVWLLLLNPLYYPKIPSSPSQNTIKALFI
jgi:spore maturation protein SpmB